MPEILGLIIGITVCCLLGSLVQKIIDQAVRNIDLIPPTGISQDDWDKVTGGKKIGDPGKWLGALERILIFFAGWTKEYTIIAGWLAFKVATKWEFGTTLLKCRIRCLNQKIIYRCSVI